MRGLLSGFIAAFDRRDSFKEIIQKPKIITNLTPEGSFL